MLHFYSSPLTHLIKPEGLPSRPDVNVIFTIYVPLFQVRKHLWAIYNAADIVLAFRDSYYRRKEELV